MTPVKKETKPGGDPENILVRLVPAETFAKLKTIAAMAGVTYNEVYNLAFKKFIEIYEAKNGKIKLHPKGKGLEGL